MHPLYSKQIKMAKNSWNSTTTTSFIKQKKLVGRICQSYLEYLQELSNHLQIIAKVEN